MFKPYKENSINVLYNLLFCDDIDLFRLQFQGELTGQWKELFTKKISESSVLTIASNEKNETRLRLSALRILKFRAKAIAPGQILGVIIEVSLPQGLDTIAAYKDGRARYINHSGKTIVWEATDSVLNNRVQGLLTVSQNVVNNIGRWDKKRLPPPSGDLVRMTFLASDGLYFGQGPFEMLGRDKMGGPVIIQATELMKDLINQTMNSGK